MVDYKPVRKTAFMMFRKCTKQFAYFYNSEAYWNYGDKSQNESVSQAKGNLFHQAANEFFDRINLQTAYQLADDKVEAYFRSQFPQEGELTDWFNYLAEIEARRFVFGRQVYKEKIMEYFKPVARELKVEMNDVINRTGHVDRIDLFPKENALCIVEYKSGKWYNLEKDRVLTEIRAETGWYAVILNANKQLPFPALYWACINPTLRQFRVEKFSPLTLKAIETQYKKVIELIKTGGEGERNLTPLCMSCPYIDECLYTLKDGETILGRLAEAAKATGETMYD